jgi:hypothetical protein
MVRIDNGSVRTPLRLVKQSACRHGQILFSPQDLQALLADVIERNAFYPGRCPL